MEMTHPNMGNEQNSDSDVQIAQAKVQQSKRARPRLIIIGRPSTVPEAEQDLHLDIATTFKRPALQRHNALRLKPKPLDIRRANRVEQNSALQDAKSAELNEPLYAVKGPGVPQQQPQRQQQSSIDTDDFKGVKYAACRRGSRGRPDTPIPTANMVTMTPKMRRKKAYSSLISISERQSSLTSNNQASTIVAKTSFSKSDANLLHVQHSSTTAGNNSIPRRHSAPNTSPTKLERKQPKLTPLAAVYPKTLPASTQKYKGKPADIDGAVEAAADSHHVHTLLKHLSGLRILYASSLDQLLHKQKPGRVRNAFSKLANTRNRCEAETLAQEIETLKGHLETLNSWAAQLQRADAILNSVVRRKEPVGYASIESDVQRIIHGVEEFLAATEERRTSKDEQTSNFQHQSQHEQGRNSVAMSILSTWSEELDRE
ncbi:hypothetical protein LTS08_002136 [Lithohypha guttulata]|nr:hypothetical protein LTS08_002136 [Lithohypha guttulata]